MCIIQSDLCTYQSFVKELLSLPLGNVKVLREDGWIEFEMGHFFNENGDNGL